MDKDIPYIPNESRVLESPKPSKKEKMLFCDIIEKRAKKLRASELEKKRVEATKRFEAYKV